MQFPQRLDILITDNDIQVTRISESIGVTRQQIRRWRKGTSEPTAGNIIALCKFFNVSADYILGIGDDK